MSNDGVPNLEDNFTVSFPSSFIYYSKSLGKHPIVHTWVIVEQKVWYNYDIAHYSARKSSSICIIQKKLQNCMLGGKAKFKDCIAVRFQLQNIFKIVKLYRLGMNYCCQGTDSVWGE